jgi:hypothetical protein
LSHILRGRISPNYDEIISEKPYIQGIRKFIRKLHLVTPDPSEINQYVFDSLSQSFDLVTYKTLRDFVQRKEM